jgi:glucose/mannose transport system permease protein
MRPPLRVAWRDRIGGALAWLAIWVPLGASAFSVLLFTVWTTWVSFTPSTLLPEYGWVGLHNYVAMLRTPNLRVAYINIVIFAIGFVLISTALGLLLAVLLDQRVRGENLLRTIFLYPFAVSFVVTGTVWSWLLNPGFGLPKLIQNLGWTSFHFDWLVQPNRAIYTIIIAGVWQAAGFAMALFLAGLRSVDADLLRAAQIDGAGTWRTYRRVVLPTIWPILVTVVAILLQNAIKTFDLVRALTNGGPGISTMVPALVVYDFMFQRGELGRGAAVAVLMLLSLLLVMAPFGVIYWLRRRREATR